MGMHFQYFYEKNQRLKEYSQTELLSDDKLEILIFLNCTNWVQVLTLPLTCLLLANYLNSLYFMFCTCEIGVKEHSY